MLSLTAGPVPWLGVATLALPSPILSLRGVRKRYGPRVAVDGLDLEVRRGETLGLLGPNGAGKSTLMKLIVGALAADDGSVGLGGASPLAPAARASIGIAPQDIALYSSLSAEENLSFFGRLHGLGGDRLRQRVEHCLELAGLAARRRDRVGTFSGGMARRLNLACAVVHEPELVLLDEPTAGVDPQSRNHIFDALERLQGAGLTIVFSTHYMEEAERMCDRVAIVDHGKLLALDGVDQLIRAHGGGYRVSVELLGELPAELADLGSAVGNRLSVTTSEPWELVSRLAAARARIAALHVERPGLESVFLALTGRSLRD